MAWHFFLLSLHPPALLKKYNVFLTSQPPPPVNVAFFSVPRLAGADIQIMVAQVATEAGAALEVIDTVPQGGVICDVECCRLDICGAKLGEFGICVVLIVENDKYCTVGSPFRLQAH